MTLIVEDRRNVATPDEVRICSGVEEDTPIRVIVTRRSDIMLMLLTGDPMNESLQAEFEAWQNLGMLSISMLPYEHAVSPYADDEDVRV